MRALSGIDCISLRWKCVLLGLCFSSSDGEPIDLWSLGCIMIELLWHTRNIYFGRKDRVYPAGKRPDERMVLFVNKCPDGNQLYAPQQRQPRTKSLLVFVKGGPRVCVVDC